MRLLFLLIVSDGGVFMVVSDGGVVAFRGGLGQLHIHVFGKRTHVYKLQLVCYL